MFRKVKKLQGYLHLTLAKPRDFFLEGSAPAGWQSFHPGDTGDTFCDKVKTLASSGASDCFIFTDARLTRKIYQQLPFWIRQLKMKHPQMDFHIRSERLI